MSASFSLNPKSTRARKARLASRIGDKGWKLLLLSVYLFLAAGFGLWWRDYDVRLSYACLGISTLALTIALWYRRDLHKLPPRAPASSLDDILESNLLARLARQKNLTPQLAWQGAISTWQGRFVCNHLLLDQAMIHQIISSENSSMDSIWQTASQLMNANQSQQLSGATLAAAILMTLVEAKTYLSKLGLKLENVAEVQSWEERLDHYLAKPHPYYGGIGRDWAAGFTPILDRFGLNISREIEHGRGHFHTQAHGDILNSVIHNLSQGSGGVALVGETGVGKTSLVYGLAERLLEGHDSELLYYQIISLDASEILSSASDQLEKMVLTLFGEAAHARNTILFLDDASLFFTTGTGAFDLSMILQPLLQARSVKIIAAMTPRDFQYLKSSHGNLAALLAPVTVSEPKPELSLKILEDTALTLEQREHLLVSFQAVHEAYRLSGQFEQELSYPGKAISLLEQSTAYAQEGVLSAESVQAAVEKIRGVKVAKAEAPEADILLHLEDHIHKRMINQQRAVSVVSAALRRGRAGVANPNRPVGSFLFLGPTGVGKTELARSLAATYFGDERQMIRLDMTEYQQADDVSRLLDSGSAKSDSLIMAIRQQPFSVVLLDEVEKAHPHVLNLMLQMLDEGQLTDQNNRPASFKNAIIIATSNAGSAEITQRVAGGDKLESFERPLIDKLISEGQFKAELVNRFDEVVLFRPLNEKELLQVAALMLEGVNKTLSNQNIAVKLTDAALAAVVKTGYDPSFGARPMRRAIQKLVEDAVAKKVLSGQAQAGTTVTLDVSDLG